MRNVWARAPYLDTHVPQRSKRYEIAKLMTSGYNQDLEKMTREFMPWGVQERKWTTYNSFAENLKKEEHDAQANG